MEENKNKDENKKESNIREEKISKTLDNVEKKDVKKEENGQVRKQNIVPSYAKKSSNSEANKNICKKGKKNKRKKSKITVVIIVMILIIFLLGLIYGIYSIINYNSNKKYKEYEKTMNIWGFSQMYDNNQASFYESVTKSEAVKLIISSTLNISDITDYYQLENSSYDNEIWVKYAESFEIIGENEINSKNEDEKISLVEFLRILSKAKTEILGLDLDIEELTKYTFVSKSNNDDQAILKDMIYNKILVDIEDNTNINKKLSKGMCNQLLYNYIKKYNTITLDGAKLNINDEKLPSNAEDYPYILASINKTMYEKRFKYENVELFKYPAEIYSDMKEDYETIKVIVGEYVDTVFNINYETIDTENFKENLKTIYGDLYNEAKASKYVDKIKNDKINIIGNGNIQFPCIYYDGVNYRVRVKMVYSIVSANDLKNIFFLDNNKEISYSLGSFEGTYDIAFNKDENGMIYICSLPLTNF